MIEIASATAKNGVFQKDISANQNISNKYLDHIIHALKAAGLITNLKGKKSGYVLSRSPSEITIFDIHNAFENGICVIDCIAFNYRCENEDQCKAKYFWNGLNKVILDYFTNTTLQDIINIGEGKLP